MIKRVVAIAFFLTLIIPVSAFAEIVSTPTPHNFHNGLLDDENIIESLYLNELTYDNDLDTEILISPPRYINFSKPVNISGYYINVKNVSSTRDNKIRFYYDDTLKTTITINQDDKIENYYNVNVSNVNRIDLDFDYNIVLSEIDFFGSYDPNYEPPIEPGQPGDTTPPAEISNVNVETTEDSATISYDNPSDVDFSHVNIYLAGEIYDSSSGQVYIDGLHPETTYTAIVKTVDTLGNESEGIEVTFTTKEEIIEPPTTPEQVPEVRNLQLKTNGERVDLSWENPPQFFDKATIYRKDLGKSTTMNWNPFAPITVSASTGFNPLFETNGTTFADLTIEPENEYEYKVTNTYNGMESNGVTVLATVPKPPLLSTDGVEIPFGVGELISSGNGLLAVVGIFVLLGLAFILVPKIIAVIRNANESKNGSSQAVRSDRVGRVGRLEREGRQPRATARQMNIATGNGREGRQPRLTNRQLRGL